MKNLSFLAGALLALMLSFTWSCKDKEVLVPFVPMTGNFTNTPNPNAGFWEIQMPDGTLFPSPKQYVVDGLSTLFGDVDETHSKLDMSNVEFNLLFGGFYADVHIVMMDPDGDELLFTGEVYSYQDFSNNGFFHVSGGTGKWENAEGWINSVGQINPLTGINTLTASGEVSKPK